MKRILPPFLFFLAGFAVCLVLLEAGLRLAGYWYLRSVTVPAAANEGASVRMVVCLGDSYTFGGLSDYQDRYPAQLQKLFDADTTKTIVCNEGICEANSSQVLAHLQRIRAPVQYAVLLVGAANRFNFAGHGVRWQPAGFIRTLRTYKMLRILSAAVKDRMTRTQLQRLSLRQARENAVPGLLPVNSPSDTALTEDELKNELADNPREGSIALGQYYLSSGRFREAERVFLSALEKDWRNEAAYERLTECYMNTGEYVKAETLLAREIKVFPEGGYVAMGRFYAKRGEYAKA
jgi:tetratricopeptide (TPR) repeat protein